MRRDDLQYDLPPDRIAQQPVEPRDSARLLVLHRTSGALEHRRFRDLPDYLGPPDNLVLNDTRVIPARFYGRRATTGGKVEGLFLRVGDSGWEVLLKCNGRLQPNEHIELAGDPAQRLTLLERRDRGAWLVAPRPPGNPQTILERVGYTPLPPYIRRDEATPDAPDRARYQTIYAAAPGAVAAPTAGLHFTPELLDRLAANGVQRTPVTLHVGLGTFAPVEVDTLGDHRMHGEWYEVSDAAAASLRRTRPSGGRVVAVGTTVGRVLESLPDFSGANRGWTDIFIYPPYRFRHVDALITNFHLPGSTLLAMVMAFAGVEATHQTYRTAIEHQYRFYSYGDAMLVV